MNFKINILLSHGSPFADIAANIINFSRETKFLFIFLLKIVVGYKYKKDGRNHYAVPIQPKPT